MKNTLRKKGIYPVGRKRFRRKNTFRKNKILRRGEKGGFMEKSRLTAVAESVVDSCRSEIYFNLKFLSLAMNRLTAEVEEDLPYDVATDGSLIKLNARWLTKAYVENPKKINRALVHLMLHCIFRHFARGKNEFFPDLWDVACDMHVESIVEDLNLPFLQTGKEQKRRALLSDYRNKISVFNRCSCIVIKPFTVKLTGTNRHNGILLLKASCCSIFFRINK
jgi:hypothetical protein